MNIAKTKPCCTVCDAKKVCHVCGEQTLMACSDCRINFGVTIFLCGNRSCREYHEGICVAAVQPVNIDAMRKRLATSGYTVVPIVPTEKMIEELARIGDGPMISGAECWGYMLAAAVAS